MAVKPIAAGTPQRIISKINEIINAVNTDGGSGGSGTADAILDAATIADAGKALGIDAEGEPALISISGGAPLLRCNLTYTGEGTEAAPYVGHLDHAADILDALDRESSYDPIIVISYEFDGEPGQLIPAAVEHRTEAVADGTMDMEYLQTYGNISTLNVSRAFMLATADLGAGPVYMVDDKISNITSQSVTIADNVFSFTDTQA